jgi:hypothetical protein
MAVKGPKEVHMVNLCNRGWEIAISPDKMENLQISLSSELENRTATEKYEAVGI